MTLPGTPATDRREAAIAAALAGAVVVVLAYASGLGLTERSQILAAQPPATTPAVTDAPVPGEVEPPAFAPPVRLLPTSPGPAVPRPGGHIPDAHEHPEEPPSPTTPPGPERECEPGLIETLPVVSALGDTVSSVLAVTGRASPLLSRLLAPPDPEQDRGVLGCVTGAVVGPSCCAGSSARQRETSAP